MRDRAAPGSIIAVPMTSARIKAGRESRWQTRATRRRRAPRTASIKRSAEIDAVTPRRIDREDHAVLNASARRAGDAQTAPSARFEASTSHESAVRSAMLRVRPRRPSERVMIRHTIEQADDRADERDASTAYIPCLEATMAVGRPRRLIAPFSQPQPVLASAMRSDGGAFAYSFRRVCRTRGRPVAPGRLSRIQAAFLRRHAASE
jgi:hypothetical protein